MDVAKKLLPKKFHDAVTKWRETYIPDYPYLIENWKKYFPKQPEFEMCAYYDRSVCSTIECGELCGKPKFEDAASMDKERADQLLKAVKAQASTELGSIQQHRLTLARAQDEKDQFWILRMMAEEMRHGYQMFSILLDDDWGSVTDTSGEDMVEEVLNMRTGSHVLGAFNVDFDSFLDNATFCAVIDRVGKYQLSMQKVSAYKPMSESMPPMLMEEAFHLAAGVQPLRRWVKEAAKDEGTISMEMIQQAFYKWFPRGLDMFGDERGGGRNVKFGFKDMKNGEALDNYYEEMEHIIDDLNVRYVRARLPKLDREGAEALVQRVRDSGGTEDGIRAEDLLRLPAKNFFRRRGPHAYQLNDVDGAAIDDYQDFVNRIERRLPPSYLCGRDFLDFLQLTKKVYAGEMEQHAAAATMPTLSRVGGACLCANAVRWVNGSNGNGHTNGN